VVSWDVEAPVIPNAGRSNPAIECTTLVTFGREIQFPVVDDHSLAVAAQ
jgi:hypothetical protein